MSGKSLISVSQLNHYQRKVIKQQHPQFIQIPINYYECCETQNQIDNYSSSLTTTTLASTGYQNVITTLFSLPTVTIPSSSTSTYTTSSLETIDEQNNSSVLGINDNNSSQKISAALISVISLSIFIISTIFTITLLRRKKQTRDDSILENQNYGKYIIWKPVPIIEQVIDSYYGNVEEGIIYENGEDEEGYLYALPQSDCDQTIFDESYESVPINQNQGQEQINSDNFKEKPLKMFPDLEIIKFNDFCQYFIYLN